MNLLNTYYRIFIISSIIICFSFLNSCYKPDQTIAVIRVLDNNTNNPIENISVRLFFDNSNGVNFQLYDVVKNTLSMELLGLILAMNIKMARVDLQF